MRAASDTSCKDGRKRGDHCPQPRALVTGAHEPILDFCDLMSVTLRGDDVEGFDTRWDEVLSSTEDVPSHNVQVSLYKMLICESEQLETALA